MNHREPGEFGEGATVAITSVTPPINSVDNETRAFIEAVQLVEDAGWVVLRPELAARRAANTPVDGVDEEDLASDERWNEGVNYAIKQLCELLGIDWRTINWDAATETLDGDVRSVIGNVLVAAYGEEWSSDAETTARIQSCLTSPAAEPVAWQGKTWFELREPGCVPQRTGPIPATEVAAFLRDLFAHRPRAYVTVITVGHDGPSLQDGPECLQMLDGRSMSTGRKHIASSSAAHQGHPAPSASREVTGAAAELIRRVRDVLDELGPGGYLLPAGAVKTNYLEAACNQMSALLAALPEREG